MALSAAQKGALETLAGEVETAASWVGSARATKLRGIAAQLRGLADGSVSPDDVEVAASPTTTATKADAKK